jgi:hypothetical protein
MYFQLLLLNCGHTPLSPKVDKSAIVVPGDLSVWDCDSSVGTYASKGPRKKVPAARNGFACVPIFREGRTRMTPLFSGQEC